MFSPLAAGKKVYAQGSYAPTRGQVDPSGYIKRELAKNGVSKKGNDGQSDTRSGVAASALKRMIGAQFGGPQGGRTQAPPVRHSGGVKGGRTNAPPVSTGGQKMPPSQYGPPGSTADPNVPGSVPAPPPVIPINDNGTLQLPYNNDYAQNVLQGQQEYNQAMLELQQQQQEEALTYQEQLRDGQYAYEDQKRRSLNDNAARGMAFSSGYGQQVGNDARMYNNFMGSLNTRHGNAQKGFETGRTGIQNTLNSYLQQLALDYGIGLQGSAGGLGFGVNPLPAPEAPAPSAPTPRGPLPPRVIKGPKKPNKGPKQTKGSGPRPIAKSPDKKKAKKR